MTSPSTGPSRRDPSRGPLALLCLALLTAQIALVGSLIVGRDTLYLRDVLQTHGAFEAAREREWTAGRPAPLDPYRAGGQPRWGNPNTLPFYPTGALVAFAPRYWSANAHLWLHVLLAPWAMAWLARRLGSGRSAALAAGVFYGTSGFVLSHLGFANLAAGAALAPALAAAFLAMRERGSPGDVLAAGACWGLLLLGGDPLYAALALLAALVVSVASGRSASGGGGTRSWTAAALALAGGSLLAAPQIGELWRVLSTSRRAILGFDVGARTLASWDPRQALDWLIPLVFGRPDRLGDHRFWGEAFHPGGWPLYLSLAPGILALALAAGAGRKGAAARAGWALLALGLFLALGRFNPLLAPLLALPGADLLRFPVKAWLLVAPGTALLAGAGWERVFAAREQPARTRAAATLLGLGLLLAGILVTAGSTALPGLDDAMPAGAGPETRLAEVGRWRASGGFVLLVIAAGLVGIGRPGAGRFAGAILVVLHAASQTVLLAPVAARERIASLEEAPDLVGEATVGPGVHGRTDSLFGPISVPRGPSDDARLLVRQGAFSALPFAGIERGLRYELNPAPEGLDAFVTFLARDAVRALEDRERVRLLSRWGVRWLVLDRPLETSEGVALRRRGRAYGAELRLYGLEDAAPAARLVAGVRSAADPRGALGVLLDPAFDPRREVVLAGDDPRLPAGAGSVDLLRDSPLELEAVTRGRRPGYLVVERTFQPLYRAEVDGEPAPIRLANLHRIAIPVPEGAHRVRLWVDRGPLVPEAAVSLIGVLLLALPALRRRSPVVTSAGP